MLMLLLWGCASRTVPAPAEPVPEPPPPPADEAAFEGTTGIVHVDRRVEVATLVDVRTGVHEQFDRVVFEFEDEIPGYHLEYVDTPQHRCGSGEEVWLPGQGWLSVRLFPARMHTAEYEATITERSRRELGGQLRALEATCDFEAEVEWVLGLDSPEPYRVFTLGDPLRLVVDVRRRGEP